MIDGVIPGDAAGVGKGIHAFAQWWFPFPSLRAAGNDTQCPAP